MEIFPHRLTMLLLNLLLDSPTAFRRDSGSDLNHTNISCCSPILPHSSSSSPFKPPFPSSSSNFPPRLPQAEQTSFVSAPFRRQNLASMLDFLSTWKHDQSLLLMMWVPPVKLNFKTRRPL